MTVDHLCDASGELSQGAIAERLGLSRERVGQIERQALRKMRALVASGEFPTLRAVFGGEGLARRAAREQKAEIDAFDRALEGQRRRRRERAEPR